MSQITLKDLRAAAIKAMNDAIDDEVPPAPDSISDEQVVLTALLLLSESTRDALKMADEMSKVIDAASKPIREYAKKKAAEQKADGLDDLLKKVLGDKDGGKNVSVKVVAFGGGDVPPELAELLAKITGKTTS